MVKKKKRNPTEILENSGNFHVEKGYVITPKTISSGSEMVETTKRSNESEVEHNGKIIEELSDRKRASLLHTHPKSESDIINASAFPEGFDFYQFFMLPYQKTMRIAQQDPVTGKVAGYFFIMKSKKTPKLPSWNEKDVGTKESWEKFREANPDVEELIQDLKEYRRNVHVRRYSNFYQRDDVESVGDYGKKVQDNLDKFVDKYHLKVKYIPTEGHEFRKGLGFVSLENNRRKSRKGLGGLLVGIFCLIASIVAGAVSITGRVVAGELIFVNLLGIFLFIIGVIFLYGGVKKPKRNPF